MTLTSTSIWHHTRPECCSPHLRARGVASRGNAGLRLRPRHAGQHQRQQVHHLLLEAGRLPWRLGFRGGPEEILEA